MSDHAFMTLEEMVLSSADAVRPPERLTVSQAADKYRKLNNKGAYVGPWKNSVVPYLVEPMDTLTSLKYTGLVFVGPAQCGKTEMYLNWHTYNVICDPADMMLIEASQGRAADFSKRRIDRLHRDTPDTQERLITGKNHDNTFDKRYRSGAMVTLSWPTVNELSGKPIPRLFLTDYDRMDQDVGGDGSPFDLASARATTFRRYGMTCAESSPSHPITDPRWSPSTPHEAPPTEGLGIMALYNRGDRRRWHWRCIDCHLSFEPDFNLLEWDDLDDPREASRTTRLVCPHCGSYYHHDPKGGKPGKHLMNQNGFWLRDGQKFTQEGEIIGEAYESEIASFWLKGVAAAFSEWQTLVVRFIRAEREFQRSGSETALKTTTNVDQGRAYLPKSMASDRVPEMLKDRAKPLGQREVPMGVRFLVASVDVQKNRFVCQVHGVGQGGDLWIIDRFDIRYSRREDEDRDGQVHYVKPFTFREDWRVLMEEVALKTYPLADGSGRHMKIKDTISDSGGMNEAASNAYEFWRWLKNGPIETEDDYEHYNKLWVPGLHGRFHLYKGGSSPTAPRTKVDYPDSGRKDRMAGARGEIPVLLVNVTPLKNQIDAMLDRDKPMAGQINFPDWLDINFYKELCVEVKNHKGVWENPKSFRNESWDLLVMAQAVLIERRYVGVERIDWTDPPSWAAEWDVNDMVYDPVTQKQPFAKKAEDDYDLDNLAEQLG